MLIFTFSSTLVKYMLVDVVWAGESHPKRPKTQQLAGKVMASVFWDAHGTLFIDYFEKGKTINSDYYIALLNRLSTEIKKKLPNMQKKKVLFHKDNAPCHNSMKTMVKLNELSFELFLHPPYSPDLAPATTGSLQAWKKCSRERDLAPMKKWLPKLRPFFWEQRRIILQKRHRKVREALEWMYCAWKKKFGCSYKNYVI